MEGKFLVALKAIAILAIFWLFHRVLPWWWYRRKIKPPLKGDVESLGFYADGGSEERFLGDFHGYPVEASILKPDTFFKAFTFRVRLSFVPDQGLQHFIDHKNGYQRQLFRENGSTYRINLVANALVMDFRFYHRIPLNGVKKALDVQTLWLENHGFNSCSHIEAERFASSFEIEMYTP